LWAGEVPARDAGATLPDAVRSAWLALELSFLGVGLVGSVRLARRGDLRALVPLALVLFVWALSFPLWAEGRFSLPAKPLLASGAWMLDHGRLLDQDVFSFTRTGATYQTGQWLGEVVLAFVYRQASWLGVDVLRAVLVGAAAFFVARATARVQPHIGWAAVPI